jgi:hypothetical protein
MVRCFTESSTRVRFMGESPLAVTASRKGGMSSTMLMKLHHLSGPCLWCQQRFWECGSDGHVISGGKRSADTGTATEGLPTIPHHLPGVAFSSPLALGEG